MIAAALIAMPSLANAQSSGGMAPSTAEKTYNTKLVTVTGAISGFSAGVLHLVGGQAVYVNDNTKVIGPMPTVNSVIIVKGYSNAKGAITATSVQVKH
jgi:hypothetical protein